ncbi:hypothetical protein Syun_030426 [Stephania yunnanensis]|uniref:Uncharacterized protein n=1 Tax=Stephania yunnanensis TaxID=152371 RepID=A0AAP0HKH6_9MAGN
MVQVFGESALGEPGEELAALEELHGEEDLGLGGEDLVELDNVGVREAVCEAKSWSPAEIVAYPYVHALPTHTASPLLTAFHLSCSRPHHHPLGLLAVPAAIVADDAPPPLSAPFLMWQALVRLKHENLVNGTWDIARSDVAGLWARVGTCGGSRDLQPLQHPTLCNEKNTPTTLNDPVQVL